MATATPSTTPNPNAMKFTLDLTWPDMFDVRSPDTATTPFQRAIMAVPGVAGLFGVNDFVTVTRHPDAPWEPIVEAVTAAAAEL